MSFPTYFLVPKSSAHFSNTKSTPGLQKKEKKKRGRDPTWNPETPNLRQLKQSQGFCDSDFLGAGRAGSSGVCQRRGTGPGAGRAAGDPVPLKPGNCVVLGHPGAPSERGICAALLLWPGLL